jgi:hypothetical protein
MSKTSEAIKLIDNGMSIAGAAKHIGINEIGLFHSVRKHKIKLLANEIQQCLDDKEYLRAKKKWVELHKLLQKTY